MFQIIPASKRYQARHGWLESYHLFSFAEYYDPDNLHFGALRVFNDDTIGAYAGFDEHGHEDMEIVTIVLEGQLTHRDSLGNQAVIRVGEVQRMSAGTGIIHAEKNLTDEPLHLYQLWFLPKQDGTNPSYEQLNFSYLEKNKLIPVASDQGLPGVVAMNTPATIYLADIETGKTLNYFIPADRGVFLYLETGSLLVNDQILVKGDQVRAQAEKVLSLVAKQDTRLILIDVGL